MAVGKEGDPAVTVSEISMDTKSNFVHGTREEQVSWVFGRPRLVWESPAQAGSVAGGEERGWGAEVADFGPWWLIRKA